MDASIAKPSSRLEQDLQAVTMQLGTVREQVRGLTEKMLAMRSRLLGAQPEVAHPNGLAGAQISNNVGPSRPMVDDLSSLAQAIQQDVDALSKALHTL